MCTTFNHVIFKMNKISKVSFLICLVEFFTPFVLVHVLGSYYFGGEKDTLLSEFFPCSIQFKKWWNLQKQK